MKNGSDGSAAGCSTPASRQVSSRPLEPAREPAPTVRPSRRATSSSRSVRTAQPSGRRDAGLAAATQRPNGLSCGLGLVDDRDQLEVGPAERHDSVRGAPARVTAALDRGQAVQRFELARGRREVGHRDQDVVELERDRRLRRRC